MVGMVGLHMGFVFCVYQYRGRLIFNVGGIYMLESISLQSLHSSEIFLRVRIVLCMAQSTPSEPTILRPAHQGTSQAGADCQPTPSPKGNPRRPGPGAGRVADTLVG